MSEARGVGRDMLWYGLATLLTGLFSFIQLYLFSRLLRPAEYGVYFLSFSIVSILNMLCFSWINQTVKRYLPDLADEPRARFIGRVVAVYLLVLVALLAVAALASVVLPLFGVSGRLPWPTLALALGTAAPIALQWFYTVRRQPRIYVFNQLLLNVARLAFSWVLLTFVTSSGEMLIWAMSAAGVLAGLVGLVRLGEPVRITRATFTWPELLAFAAYGWPLALSNSAGWLLNMLGRLMLAAMSGLAAAGVYSAAHQFTQQVVTLAVQPLLTASDSQAIRLHASEGPVATGRFLSIIFGLLLLLGGGVCLILVMLAQPLTLAVLDREYVGAARLFPYLAPAMLLWLLTPVFVKSQEIGEQLGELPLLTGGGVLLNVVLNFLLIPPLGALGAAVAMLVAYVALAVASYWRGQRHLQWGLPGRLLLLAAAALCALALALRLLPAPAGLGQVALAFSGYMLGYLGLCAALMLIGRRWFHSELAFLRQLATRRAAPAAAPP